MHWESHFVASAPQSVQKKETFEGILRCNDVFQPFVQMGEEVETGKMEEHTYHPIKESQTKMSIRVYAVDKVTPQPNVFYTDEEGMQLMGKFSVEMPDLTGGKDRPVKLCIEYGGTEISLQATDVTSGEQNQTEIDFLTE